MISEIHQRHNYLAGNVIDSIYFGGGTPSLLLPEELRELITALRIYFTPAPDFEFTLEANPDDINDERLEKWKEIGINRLSIGLQSFNDSELKWMNRAHTSEESIQSVKKAQAHGFNNITIDLIYGSKFQTEDSWKKTLETAISLGTPHISAYNLTVEQKTALGKKVGSGEEPFVSDDLSRNQFEVMLEALGEAGFIQYEISNFGKPGFFAKHNSNYWLQTPYLGIGPSAHSFDGKSRQWNIANNHVYIRRMAQHEPYFEKEELSRKDQYNEYVLTRLRTIWGCDLSEMEKSFGKEAVNHFVQHAALKAEFIEVHNDVYLLNREGKTQADGIASSLFLL
jgi:oxygen-independent coproporphyrinogen-3 oxidase